MDLPDFIFDKMVDIIIGLSLGIFIMILHLRAHRDVDEVIKKIDERTAKEQEIDSRVETKYIKLVARIKSPATREHVDFACKGRTMSTILIDSIINRK